MHKTLVVCAILVACVALNQAAKTKTRGYPDLKTTKTRNSDRVTRNGLFRWTSFNNVDVFNTNDDGTTWNWVQNGRIIMRFDLNKADWTVGGVFTIILKRKDVDFFVKLTPYEVSWGTTAEGTTNFYAYGQWKDFGNSLNDQTNADTVDSTDVDVVNKFNKRVVPIPSRFLKDTPVQRNGVFKWTFLNDVDFFNTNDDGTTWNWVQGGRIIMRFDLVKTEWTAGNVFTIILKRKDVDFFIKLTPYEAYWGITEDTITNFSGNGKWKDFGNSINDQTNADTVDSADVDVMNKFNKRVVPIPSRFLKDTQVQRNGLFRWTSFNNVDVFNTNDDGTTWNWIQNGRIIMRFDLNKADWTVGGVFTIILKRKDVDFFVKLTPYEVSWGTTAEGTTNFYAYGQWKDFGNSLNEQINDNTADSTDVNVVDRSTRRSVPIPSRILKKLTAPVVRNGVFRWKLFNKDEFFNTNDDGSVWLWFQTGRNTIQLDNFKLEWNAGSVLTIILKRKDVDFFVKLTPTEAFWGTSQDSITNFYASGGWDAFGNSLGDQTSDDTTNTDDVDVVDKIKRRVVPIPRRYLKSY